MYCTKCGERNDDRAVTCRSCGEPLRIRREPPGAYVPPRSSGKAVASLVLGILSLVGCIFLAGIPAIILGWLARRDIRRSDGRLSGGGLAMAGVVSGILGSVWSVAVIGMLAAIAMPNFREAQARAKIARVRSDLRTLAVVNEAYYVDNRSYPAWVMGRRNGMVSYNATVAAPPAGDLPCYVISGPTGGEPVRTLTSPVAYISNIPTDIFAPEGKGTYVYWSLNPGQRGPSDTVRAEPGVSGWILLSPGPDGDYDIPPHYDAYDPNVPQPSIRLLTGTNGQGSAFTYDPTNGTVSDGDIWRVKQ